MAKPKLREWPADKTERWPLDKIIPYERNPRFHSEEQIAQIAASIQRFGVTTPVLVDEQGVLIYGHGRLLAAKQLGLKEFPVAIARGWSEDEKRAYRVADNQLGLASEWDMPALNAELIELSAAGFDMSLLGFDAVELTDMMVPELSGEEAPQESRELSGNEQERLDAAWRPLVREWGELWRGARDRGYASPTFVRSALAVHFVRAQLYGTDIPRNATISYNLHRMSEIGDAKSMDELFERVLEDDDKLHSLQFMTGGVPVFDKLFMGLAIYSHRMPQEFPAALARGLIGEFCPKGGAVLDPCHGWGGRLLGFLLSEASSYTGFDASEQTVKGVRAMADDLIPFAIGERKVKLTASPFEDVKLPEAAFDFALTSPPYFNTEKYGGARSSWRRYRSYDKWRDGFYAPMIEKVSRGLREGALFALQVGSQAYPLEDDCKKISAKHKLAHVATRQTEIVNNQMGHIEGEVVIVLRKLGHGARRGSVKADPALEFGRVL
jgi:ParB-like chromosome segregation protein Spo0J